MTRRSSLHVSAGRSRWPAVPTIAALAAAAAFAPAFAQQPPPPAILYDAAPRAIEYQLARLSNEELTRVERKAGDVKYRPVFVALLTRKGLGREYFDEALGVLTRMDKSSPTAVLLEAAAKITPEDDESADRLLRVLLAQPVDALRAERARLAAAAETPSSSPVALRAAYGALMIADGDPRQTWDAAAARDGHLVELLRSVPHLGAASVRARLFDPIAALLTGSQDATVRAAALSALGWTRADAATFQLITREVLQTSDPAIRAAGVRALRRIPAGAWPAAEVEPLARALVAALAKASADDRTGPAAIDATHLAEQLADALPEGPRRAVRRDLRALGVQIVRIETVPEQMAFDLKWFAVEAGKPVQIVLSNPDAMSHNLVVVKAGALKEVGAASITVSVSPDSAARPYVPDTPLVLHATRLLNWGEADRLSFTAPTVPGEYPFVCTFPGHWVRMYGVMLVVESLDAWEAQRAVPADPMTGKPFPSPRH